MKTEVFKTDNS